MVVWTPNIVHTAFKKDKVKLLGFWDLSVTLKYIIIIAKRIVII